MGLDFFLKKCCGVEDDSFSVGNEVAIGDENKEDSLLEKDADTLIDIIYDLRERLAKSEPKPAEAAKEDSVKGLDDDTKSPEKGQSQDVTALEPRAGGQTA